jgi:hypothetical protein
LSRETSRDDDISQDIRDRLLEVLQSAFLEINQIIGYEYFDKATAERKSKELYTAGLGFAEKVLRETRGVSLRDLKIEELDEEKTKRAALRGIFHGLILTGYRGSSFEEKYEDYLLRSGIEQCSWISKTDYNTYYNTYYSFVSKINSDKEKIFFINEFVKRKIYATTQHLAKISRKGGFYQESAVIDEALIDDHIDIFKDLGAILENYLKLLYAIKQELTAKKEIDNIENTNFYEVWKSLRDDPILRVFTAKSFPNTIYWNASKHDGITKKIDSKGIEFRSNEGVEVVSYSDFVSLVREMYSVAIVLGKINLMVGFQTKLYV